MASALGISSSDIVVAINGRPAPAYPVAVGLLRELSVAQFTLERCEKRAFYSANVR